MRRRRHEPIGAQRCADGGDGGVHLDGGEADRSAEQAARLDLEGIGGGDGGCEGGCDGGPYITVSMLSVAKAVSDLSEAEAGSPSSLIEICLDLDVCTDATSGMR